MNTITFCDDLTGTEYNELRKAVDWGIITDKQAKRGLEHTTFLVCARDNDKAVAMGRVLFDYGYTAYIGDVIVSPQYQNKGIGTTIVQMLMEKVMNAADVGDRIMFILGAARGKEKFYEKLGFHRRPNDRSGCGMSVYIIKEEAK